MKKYLIIAWILVSAVTTGWGQEETVKLDAFSVVTSEFSDRSYTPPPVIVPQVAITLRKPASAVVMEVALTNSSDKPDIRNRELYATIDQIEKAILAEPGLRLEKREIQLRGDARKRTLFNDGKVTSLVSVGVYADLAPEKDLFILVKKIRAAVIGVPAVGATKVIDGPVSLVLRDVDQYRQEILTKIFADLELIRKGIGPGMEILPSGFDSPIQTRAASEKDVELWIPYRFTIRSLTEIQARNR